METNVKTIDSVNAMIQFIADNQNVLDKYDVRSMYEKAFDNKFRSVTGIYANKNNAEYFGAKTFKLNSELTVEQNASNFRDLIQSKGIDYDLYVKFYDIKHVFESGLYIRDFEKLEFTLVYSNSNSSLFDLLKYVLDGTTFKDRSFSNEFMEKHFITYNQNSYSVDLGNIRVKKYVNSNLVLKGLTDEQIKRLGDMFKIATQLRY
jgi:hypothetical protein